MTSPFLPAGPSPTPVWSSFETHSSLSWSLNRGSVLLSDIKSFIEGFIRKNIEGFLNNFRKWSSRDLQRGFYKAFVKGFIEDFIEGFIEGSMLPEIRLEIRFSRGATITKERTNLGGSM